MLFADHIKLIDEINKVVDQKIELWRIISESSGFRTSRVWLNTCTASLVSMRRAMLRKKRLDRIAVPRCKQFIHLGSLFQENGMINEDVITS